MRWHDRLLSIEAFRRRLGRPSPQRWLSPAEAERLRGFRCPEHAVRWLGGRWLAKQVLAEVIPGPAFSPAELHIESRDGRGRASRPQVYLRGSLQPWSISISHSAHSIYAAATLCPTARLGADVIELRPLAEGFMDFWFAAAERAWCRRQSDRFAACAVWSLKEALYKAENRGEPFAPRRVDALASAVVDGQACSPWPLTREMGTCVFVGQGRTVVIRRTHREIATLVVVGCSFAG